MTSLYPNSSAARPAGQSGTRYQRPAFLVLRLIARGIAIVVASLLATAPPAAAAESGTILGLPFSRFYSFEEIGNASRGARLGFDSLGRLAITHQGSYVVLNDNTWTDLADKKAGGTKFQQVSFDAEGRAYYGALGTWGVMEFTAEGLLSPRPLRPKSLPPWVMASHFTHLLSTPRGVFFASFNGVAYWDRAADEHVFFEVPQLSRIFQIRESVFVWSLRTGIQQVDLASGSLRPVTGIDYGAHMADQVTALDEGHVLVATIAGRLMIFDGSALTPWSAALGAQPRARVSALQRLVDGSVAVAINGRGLYIVSANGEIRSSYTSAEYHRIIELATREAGVLWVETENGVEKILYDSALTVFGQRVGLPISWPQVVRWKDRVVVASGGRLYEAAPGTAGEAARFELIPGQPTGEIWALAANGERMVVGNGNGMFARSDDGRFTPVLTGIDVARLVMVSPELCFAIGTSAITALRYEGGRWSECAERVPAVGFPSVALAAGESAWVELAANRVARLLLREGRLQTQVFERFPWEPTWINLGVVGDTVALVAPGKGRMFFDEKTEAFVAAPELARRLDRFPYPIARLREDETGTIWAAYEQGLLMLGPAGGEQPGEIATFSVTNDRFPIIHLLPRGDVWMSTGQSLYRVDRRGRPQAEPPFHPMVVSIVDGHTHRELFSARQPAAGPLRLNHAEGNLMIRFFAGSYASRRSPAYEFKLNRGSDAWVPMAEGSLLTLNDLRDGSYRLAVRLAGTPEAAGDTLAFEFEIAPPWFRTWYAYTLYTLGAIFVVLVLIRLSVSRTRSRNLVLERIVQERTDELRAANQQLNEETRNAATVAERNRLAGEIHDSLQQGLSGLILQLDATLKLPSLPPDVRSRLNVARNMVSFTRHEVQHAVWDMESPLLEDAELGTALRKIAALISPETPHVEISVTGSSAAFSSLIRHHLLRIAQEAITNAVRHAAAKTITVALVCEADAVSLSVTDDGNGFVPDHVLSNGIGHFGLRSLRGRASKIGGEIQIQSAPGLGTSIKVIITRASAYTHATAG